MRKFSAVCSKGKECHTQRSSVHRLHIEKRNKENSYFSFSLAYNCLDNSGMTFGLECVTDCAIQCWHLVIKNRQTDRSETPDRCMCAFYYKACKNTSCTISENLRQQYVNICPACRSEFDTVTSAQSLALCRPSGCTVASGVVAVGGVCNRSQMRTSKCTCLIFGVSIGLDPG